MTDTYRFWTHGADVIVEHTREYTGDDNGLHMRRAGWGAQITQNQGSTNWFHFAIPSATRLDDDFASYYAVWLRARVNNDAVIDRVHVREAPGPQSNSPVIYDSGAINLTGVDDEFHFNLPDRQCRGPLLICVHVTFEGQNGLVVFAGAGGWFEEWT